MLLNFNEIKELTVPGMNSGTGMVTARMYMDCLLYTSGRRYGYGGEFLRVQ